MFTKDLETIDRLRDDAINVREPHASGIKKLAAYAAQLSWIGGKFPIDMLMDVFERPISQNNLRFEYSNVLYNLAALYSQLAYSLNRSSTDGLKSACNYFCQAAGVISYLRTDVIPDMRTSPADDMDDATLESLEHLLLGQAQECFWQKAVMDGLKDASISKLAAKVSDYYAESGDWALKSDAISSEWIHHMTAKHHHFAGAAQYRAACDCLEKRKYGEEVARLRDCLNCVNEGLKESRYINKTVLSDLHGLKNKVQEDLKRSEKDNDIIYLIPVPPKSELRAIDRANMATVKIPKEVSDSTSFIGDHGIFGTPLFSKLVPFSVHIAASIYNERRDRLVNHTIIAELDALTSELHEYVFPLLSPPTPPRRPVILTRSSVLRLLNLPGSLQALEKPLGLPPGLVAHAEEIRQQDGLNRLWRSISDVAKLKANDTAVYSEAVDLLRAEAAEDERARTRYGTERWRRPTSKEAATKLNSQIDEIQGYLKSASNSDELVKEKLNENERLLKLLAGTDRDLEDFVPSSRRAAVIPKVEREAARLRGALNEVGKLESRRRRKIEALREKAKADDINTVILAEAARLERAYPMQKIEPAQFESLFEERLQRYNADEKMLADERVEQSGIEARLREANSAFCTVRKGDTSTREREQALQKLENAYFKYKEIVSNLDVGRKFYNDLARIVGRFRDDSKNFVYHRRFEAEHIETDLSTGVANLSISDSLQQQRHRPTEQPSYDSQAPVGEPLAAPVPTRNAALTAAGMWTPDMGIKFGALPQSTLNTTPSSSAAAAADAAANPRVNQQQQQHVPLASRPGQQGQQWTPDRGFQFGPHR
ncbi:MAG: hypothetical protein M1825_000738 [Sarcosagium campestre]|nr:MAG: hypothetical protein M1825_000738 [Sarcosagium campestre]